MKIQDLLKAAVDRKASDLHIIAGLPPAFRIGGEITVDDSEKLSPADTKRLVYELLNDNQKRIFEERKMISYSTSDEKLGHFRISVNYDRGAVEAAIRIRERELKTLAELGLPEVVTTLGRKSNGLILITGPSGVGKTTTLYSMIDLINNERRCKIITVEDPIEYYFAHHKSIIVQQEVGSDVDSFSSALVHILRLDPEVICIGELRDLETISTALTAAETGHLVIATLHTPDASQSINRIVDVFPTFSQSQVRAQMAGCLQGVISQVLLPSVDGKQRVMACETLVATNAMRAVIREGHAGAMYTILETSKSEGMQTMDHSLRDLYGRGIISYDTAISRARNPKSILQ